MERAVIRLRGLFPRLEINAAGDGIKIEDAQLGSVCWVNASDIEDLGDIDVEFLVTSLLHGVLR